MKILFKSTLFWVIWMMVIIGLGLALIYLIDKEAFFMTIMDSNFIKEIFCVIGMAAVNFWLGYKFGNSWARQDKADNVNKNNGKEKNNR